MNGLVLGVRSDRSTPEAVALASVLARSLDSDVQIVTVVSESWSPRRRAADAPAVQSGEQPTGHPADAVLQAAAQSLEADVQVSTLVLRSSRSAAATLTDHVEQSGADLLVVGSSTGSDGRLSIGSTTSALLHRCAVPLAVAPDGYDPPPGTPLRRVSVGVSGSSGQQAALDTGVAWARTAKATLRLVTVLVRDVAMAIPLAGYDAEAVVDAQWRADLAALQDELCAGVPDDVTVETAIVEGTSWACALDALDADDGEVLVIGSSPSGVLRRVFLGTHSGKIVRNAGMPVVVVPAAEEG
jgi:nucleotide-binding universal stress UspA family protein